MAAGGGDEEAREGERRSKREIGVACDHCNEAAAILYCRADSAKLCVMCDQHVHSANPLSLKHIRSQICHNCACHPVSFHCVSDNLLLCQDCDSDAHSSITNHHHRNPVQGFNGCPSASQLASHLGFDFPKLLQHHSNTALLKHYHSDDDNDGVDNQFTVPTTTTSTMFGEVYSKGLSSAVTITSTSGNQNRVILKQLIDLFHSQQQHQHFQIHHQEERGEEEDAQQRTRRRVMTSVNDDQHSHSLFSTQSLSPQRQLPPFTSLDVINEPDQGAYEQGEPGQVLWNTHPSQQATQIWDFNRGCLRGSGPLELGEDADDALFTVGSYSELLTEASLDYKKGTREMYGMNSTALEKLFAFKMDPAAGATSSESNSLPIARESSGLGFGIPKYCGGSTDIQYVQQIMRCENTTIKNDVDLMAKNRDNAMLRYKEKKKTRR